MESRLLIAVVTFTALASLAAPPKKKQPVAPKPDAPELKAAPAIQPVPLEPAPAPVVTPPAAAVPAARVQVVETVVEPELTPLPTLATAGLSVQATGGVIVPFAGLQVGGRAELRASYWLGKVPLAISLGVAFEQHTLRTAALFAPAAGGFDENTLDNQTLLPFEVGVLAALFRDGHNRVHLGANYGLLAVWGQTVALGATVLESGVGHEVSGEAGYTRRVGHLELTLKLRYSVRRTAVGPRTSTIEMPWYQTFGVVAGLGFFL